MKKRNTWPENVPRPVLIRESIENLKKKGSIEKDNKKKRGINRKYTQRKQIIT